MREVFEGLTAGLFIDALVFLLVVPLAHRHLDRIGAPGGRWPSGRAVGLIFLALAAICLVVALA